MQQTLEQIDTEWSHVAESGSVSVQKNKLQHLFIRATKLATAYPDKADPKIIQACILLSTAELEDSFSALSLVHQAKDLLLRAISIDPDARKGSAVFTLGILYYKVPGWPVGFGDNDKAERMLLSSLSRTPESIGSNYYYGEFLLEQDRAAEAEIFFKRATLAKLPPNEPFEYKIQQRAFSALAELI